MSPIRTFITRRIRESIQSNPTIPYLQMAATVNLITVIISALYMVGMLLQASYPRAGIAFSVLLVSAIAYRLATTKYYPLSYYIPPYFITLVTVGSIALLRFDHEYPLLLMPVAFAFFVTGVKHGLILIAFQTVLMIGSYHLFDVSLEPNEFLNQMVVYFSLGIIFLILKLFQQIRIELAVEQSQAIIEAERKQQALRWQVERDQIITQFIINVSHDFRTPLTVIRNHAYLLDKSDNAETLKERQEAIDKATDQIMMIVDEMVDLAKLSQNTTAKKSGAHLTQALQSVLYKFDKKRIQLELDPSPLTLEIGPEELNIVLSKITENALKFSPPETPVKIRTQLDTTTVDIEISDCGPGIPTSELDHIFTPFYKLDKTRNADINPGSGLGLTIAKTITNQYNGHINVQSEVGKGSTFTVTLPVSMNTESAPDPA